MQTLKHFQSFTTFSERSKALSEEQKLQEKTAAQEKYASFFKDLLKKYDVTSPAELSDEQKSKFFDEVKGYSGTETDEGNVAEPEVNESEAQEKYQSFFKEMLAKYKVNSPAELSDDEKTKFFAEIKSGKVGSEESTNEGLDNSKFSATEKSFDELISNLKSTGTGWGTRNQQRMKDLAKEVKELKEKYKSIKAE